MSGHSKWSNIKNRKAAVDAKRGKVFSQIARNIRAAVREGGSGDPKINTSLRVLLEKARAANMPNQKIKKAIDCALGKGDGGAVKEVVYEVFGPGGVGMLAVCLTNNSNRTTAEIKNILSKAGGSLGSPGSVMYMFTRGNQGEYLSNISFKIDDEAQQKQLQGLMNQLREHEDIEDVYCVGEWKGRE